MQKTSIYRDKPITFLSFEHHPNAMNEIDEHEVDVKHRHWNIKQGDIVLDIGAAVGAYTLTALSQGAARVIAWEPGMPNYLRRNLEANNWQHRCTVIDEALWSEQGFIKTAVQVSVIPQYSKTVSDEDWKCDMEQNNTYPKSCYMKCRTLDSSIAMHEPYIDIVKIDVEGAELEVLKGGRHLIEKFKPDFLIENHTFLIPTIYKQCKTYLLQCGYKEILTTPYHSVSHSFYSYQ